MSRKPDEQLQARIAAHLRQLMEDRGWNQTELSVAIGQKEEASGVSRWLTGQRVMGLTAFALLHTRLGLDANKLLDEDPLARFFDATGAASDPALELEAIAASAKLPPELAARVERLALRLRKAPAKRRRDP
jgi:transcriptional regulator with XRE-family HTH domain